MAYAQGRPCDLTSSPHDDFIKLRKHLDEFIRLYLVIGVNIDKKDQVILLLSSLPKVYEHSLILYYMAMIHSQ